MSCFVNQGWVCKIRKGIVPTTSTITVPPTFTSNFVINSNLFLLNKCLYKSDRLRRKRKFKS
jgi:hypothetical protein